MKFYKKPVMVEAVQLRWATWNEVCDFLGDIISPENPGATARRRIRAGSRRRTST